MPPLDVDLPFREDDPFLDSVVSVWVPVYGALGAQDAAALRAPLEQYPEFREAYAQGKVSHHILIARSEDLPKEDTFERVAAGAERCRRLGYEFMVTEVTNQWAGCAYASPRSRLSRSFARAANRSKESRRVLRGSSPTRTAGA